MQNKKPFELIFHVGRVTSLHIWVAKKSCHAQTLINECSISDYLSSLDMLRSLGQSILRLRRYGCDTSKEESLWRKKEKNKVEEIQLTNLASLGSLASKNRALLPRSSANRN